jgi:membrane protease YdiL (CAAX protease family)
MLPDAAPPERTLAVKMFLGPHGLRSGWRFLLFVLIFALATFGAQVWVARPLHRFLPHDWRAFVDQAAGAFSVLFATWIMSLVEGKPAGAFGLGPVHRTRNLVTGVIAGFAALSLLISLLVFIGAYRIESGDVAGLAALGWGLYWAALFSFVGLNEELTTRGYPLFALSQGIGFLPAAGLLSILFGMGHLGNGGEQAVGIVNAVLAGMVFAFSLWWTGSLWWAIGCHMSWDWAESFFYGVADSGNVAPHHFLSGKPVGAGWLSGGSVGPEGSLLAAAALLLLMVSVCLTLPRHRVAGLERLRAPAPPLRVPVETPPAAPDDMPA